LFSYNEVDYLTYYYYLINLSLFIIYIYLIFGYICYYYRCSDI